MTLLWKVQLYRPSIVKRATGEFRVDATSTIIEHSCG